MSDEEVSADPQAEFTGKTQGMASQVVRGGLWGLGGQAITLLTSFAATPFIIRLLGTEYYGLLTLINIIIGYFAFSDIGVGIASTKYGTEARARGDDKSEAAVVWTSLLVIAVPLIIVSGLLFIGAGFLVDKAFHIPPYLAREAKLALKLIPLIVSASAISGVLNTPQLVRLRYDLNSAITTGSAVLQTCTVLATILLGGKIIGALIVMASVSGITVFLHVIVSSRLFPQMLIFRINRKLIKPLLKFGLGILAIAAISLVIVHGEKFLLVRLGSVKMLAYYNVAFTLAGLLALLTTAVCQPLLPTFVYLWSGREHARMERLYNAVMRAVLLVNVPGAILICVCARDFLSLWAGPEYGRESVIATYILVLGWLVNSLSFVPKSMLTALGEVNIIARYQALEMIPYFLLSVILIGKFGAPGAALAWSLRMIVESILLSYRVHRIIGMRFLPMPEHAAKYFCSLIVVSLPVLMIPAHKLTPIIPYATAIICIAAYIRMSPKALLSIKEQLWIREQIASMARSLFRNK